VQIELKDHIGTSTTGQLVDFSQWIVMCDGTHVGYLGKYEGAWLACIVFMDEPTKAELIEAVSNAARLQIGGAALPVDPDLIPDDEDEQE
jgi:hypothetical protein